MYHRRDGSTSGTIDKHAPPWDNMPMEPHCGSTSIGDSMRKDTAPLTLSVPEAGERYFGLCRNAAYDAAARGEIPTIRNRALATRSRPRAGAHARPGGPARTGVAAAPYTTEELSRCPSKKLAATFAPARNKDMEHIPTAATEAKAPDHRPITLLDKWKFVKQAIADKRLTAGDIRCLVAIADCYNSSKARAWPSYSYISQQTGLSRSAIARSVSKLHALDIIHKVSGGTGRANTYRPAFREPPPEIASPETGDTSVTHETGTKHETSLTEETTPVSRTTPDPSHACDTIPLNPRSISVGDYRGIPADGGAARAGGALRPVGGAPGDDGFEQFWSSYPKREGRALAKRAYSSLVDDGIAPDTLIAKAQQYAEAKADVDAKWLKMPANWLKEECWLEDPQPPRPRGPKPDRTAKPKPPKGKTQEPTPAAERVVNRQQPVAKSANPVVQKPALDKSVASQTDKAHASREERPCQSRSPSRNLPSPPARGRSPPAQSQRDPPFALTHPRACRQPWHHRQRL